MRLRLACSCTGPILTRSPGTWTAYAQLNDLNNLGIASFSIDILATGGITLAKAATTSQTNQGPNPPFSLFRTTGTLTSGNGNSLTSITGSQDNIGAASNNDDSGLVYGYGEFGVANGTFVGQVTGKGLLPLATGRWTNSGSGGTIFASVTPGSFFGLFPNNWDANDSPSPAGSAKHNQCNCSFRLGWHNFPRTIGSIVNGLGLCWPNCCSRSA